MPPVQWPLRNRRPAIELMISLGKRLRRRRLLADTGAGSNESNFELLLRESDCQRSSDILLAQVQLGHAYSGLFNVYLIEVRIAELNFSRFVSVAAVPQVPDGFDGIACFKFLNRFHYGNFGDPDRFGLGQ
jgi:hypothetical protein